MTRSGLIALLRTAGGKLDVDHARREADRFVREQIRLELWSRDFFREIIDPIQTE